MVELQYRGKRTVLLKTQEVKICLSSIFNIFDDIKKAIKNSEISGKISFEFMDEELIHHKIEINNNSGLLDSNIYLSITKKEFQEQYNLLMKKRDLN